MEDKIDKNGLKLGKGSFGEVRSVKINNKEYAHKIMEYDLSKLNDIEQIIQNLKEILVMLNINNVTDQKPLPLSYNYINDD